MHFKTPCWGSSVAGVAASYIAQNRKLKIKTPKTKKDI